MNNEQVEGYVNCLLESWAVHDEGNERGVYQVLHDLLTAWAYYELMSADERALVTALCKKMQHHFDTKCMLKERKRKTTKEKFPLKPLLKEKEKKETREENPPTVGDADLEAFRKECLGYVGKYETDQVADFYRHWTERNPTTGKMRWQAQRYWNTETRLKRWVKNQYSVNDAAASERLKKARGKQQKANDDEARSKQLAAEREAADARREREQEESKAGAVSRAEWEAIKAAREKGESDHEE